MRGVESASVVPCLASIVVQRERRFPWHVNKIGDAVCVPLRGCLGQRHPGIRFDENHSQGGPAGPEPALGWGCFLLAEWERPHTKALVVAVRHEADYAAG